jgi:hypothetical protein
MAADEVRGWLSLEKAIEGVDPRSLLREGT